MKEMNQIREATSRFAILRMEADGQCSQTTDILAIEEPLEIKVGYGPAQARQYKSVSVTMRTPGHDAELALGFLFTEGIIGGYQDVTGIRWAGKGDAADQVIVLDLRPSLQLDIDRLERHFYTGSSCGLCGKASLEQLSLQPAYYPTPAQPQIKASALLGWPDALRADQSVFDCTGGLHAVGLFEPDGQLLLVREDVGRHNAFDKLVGAALRQGWLPLRHKVALLSGRASFELVQKALMAGLPALAAVGAPSSLAVELAQEYGLSLIGFLRNQRFNVYSGEERIIFAVQ